MAGTIRSYQKCPRCHAPFPSSKGGLPIVCNPCQTQPTKYFINIWWNGNPEFLYHDRDGRTIHDWAHAVAVLGEIRARMASHKSGKGFFDPSAYKRQSSTSFKAFWKRFVDGYSGSTKDKIRAVGTHHLTYFHDYQMRDIVSWHVDEWWREIQKKGLSPAYCNDIQTWLRSFFNNALRLDVITKLPVFPAFLKTESPEIEWLTEAEQIAVLNEIPEHDRPIFDFLFLTGVRVNEACALHRMDIDRGKGVVTIRNTVKRDGEIGMVKNKKARRIPLEAVEPCFQPANNIISIDGYIFTNKWNRRYSDDYLRDTFSRACDKAGVKRIKLKNATRHSFGMGLLRKGYDIWQVSKIMGHSDIKVTEHYAKMVDRDVQGAYGRQEEIKGINEKLS